MASPIGHALAGIAIGRIGEPAGARGGRALWIACAVLAVAPDFDFVPGILAGQPALYHQGVSHSLAVAVIVSGLAALALAGGGRFASRWGLLFAAYTSHFVFDLFGPDGRPPIGIPLFWPLSDATYLSPVTLLPGVHHARSTSTQTADWLASIASWYNAKAILIELVVATPLLLLAQLRQRTSGPAPEDA